MFTLRTSSHHPTISAVALALVVWLLVLTSHRSGPFQSVEAKSAHLLTYLQDGQSLPPRNVSYKWLVKRDDDEADDESTTYQNPQAEESPQQSTESTSRPVTSDGDPEQQQQQPTKERAEDADADGPSDTSAKEEQQFEQPDENLEHEEQHEGEQASEPEDLSDVKAATAALVEATKTANTTVGNSTLELTSAANANTTTATEVPKAEDAKVEVEQPEPAQQQNVLPSGPLMSDNSTSTPTLSSAGTATQEFLQEQIKAVVQQVDQSADKILEAGPTQANQTETTATAIEPNSTDSTKLPANKVVVPEDFVSPSIKIAELPKSNTTQEEPVQSKESNRVDLTPPTTESASDSRSTSIEQQESDNTPSVVGTTSPPPVGYSTELPTTTNAPPSTSTEVSGASSPGGPEQPILEIKPPGAGAELPAEIREDQVEQLGGSVESKAPPPEEAKPTAPTSQVADAVKAGTQTDQQHELDEPKQDDNPVPPPPSNESATAAIAAAAEAASATTLSQLPNSQQLDSNTIRQDPEPSLDGDKNFETPPDEVVGAPELPAYKLDLASCSSYSTSNSSETQLKRAVESILNTLTSYECRQLSSRRLKLEPLVNKQIQGHVLESSSLPLETGQFTETQLNRVSCLPNNGQVSSAKAIRIRLDQDFDDQYLLARWRLYQRLQQEDLPEEVFKSLARSKINQVPQRHLQRSVVASNKCQRFQVETGDYYLELLSLSTSSIYEVELPIVGGAGSISSNGNEGSLLNASVPKVRLLDLKACSLYLDHGLVKVPPAAQSRSNSAYQLMDQQRQQTVQVLHANNNHFRRSNWLLDYYGNWLKHEYRRQLRVLFNGGQLRDQLSLCFPIRGN